MASINDLSAKDIVQLRLKCLEPIIMTASKAGLDKDQAIQIARRAWDYAIETLEKE